MPEDILKPLQANLPERQNNRFRDEHVDAIREHIISGGEASLSPLQQRLLERWRFADEQIRDGKLKRSDIAKLIIDKFQVSRDTAFRDLVNAENVFSSSFPMNKKYQIGLLIEEYTQHIKVAALGKDWKAVAALGKTVAEFWKAYPDTVPAESPKTFIFNIVNSAVEKEVLTEDAAFDIIENELNKEDE